MKYYEIVMKYHEIQWHALTYDEIVMKYNAILMKYKDIQSNSNELPWHTMN